jgi:hypothetical protein
VGERLKPAVLKNTGWYYRLNLFNHLRYRVLGVIWRHLVPIFNFLGNRWATQKEVGQQLGLAYLTVLEPPQPRLQPILSPFLTAYLATAAARHQ